MTLATQMQLYVKRWRPSELKLDPLEEIILETANPDDLKKKVQ